MKTDNDTDNENDKEIEDQQITTTSENLLVQTEDIRKVVFKVIDGNAARIEVETGISDNIIYK